MRVLYTIPGWQPQPAATEAAGGASFAATLERVAEPPVSWRQALRLDLRRRAGSGFPERPRPEGMARLDPAEAQARMRTLLQARRSELEKPPSDDPGERAVQAMLALLTNYQAMHDQLEARALLGTKG